jgi:hypothetical protein
VGGVIGKPRGIHAPVVLALVPEPVSKVDRRAMSFIIQMRADAAIPTCSFCPRTGSQRKVYPHGAKIGLNGRSSAACTLCHNGPRLARLHADGRIGLEDTGLHRGPNLTEYYSGSR